MVSPASCNLLYTMTLICLDDCWFIDCAVNLLYDLNSIKSWEFFEPMINSTKKTIKKSHKCPQYNVHSWLQITVHFSLTFFVSWYNYENCFSNKRLKMILGWINIMQRISYKMYTVLDHVSEYCASCLRNLSW
jgi:hypothetical protein